MNPSEGALAITRGRMGTHPKPVFRKGALAKPRRPSSIIS